MALPGQVAQDDWIALDQAFFLRLCLQASRTESTDGSLK